MRIVPHPKGERIKLIGDSSKKLFFNCGTTLSVFMISLKPKLSISPVASEYLLLLLLLVTVMTYVPAPTSALYSGPVQ